VGHQMRAFEPSMAHVPRRAANVLTGATHPTPNFMPFTTSMFCANEDVLRSTSAAVMGIRSMTASHVGMFVRFYRVAVPDH
jgi:hypothetical protein